MGLQICFAEKTQLSDLSRVGIAMHSFIVFSWPLEGCDVYYTVIISLTPGISSVITFNF